MRSLFAATLLLVTTLLFNKPVSSTPVDSIHCGIGEFFDGSQCSPCPIGFWSQGGRKNTNCIACPPGTGTISQGSTTSESCVRCDAGTGGRYCSTCDAGYYSYGGPPGLPCYPCAQGFTSRKGGECYRCHKDEPCFNAYKFVTQAAGGLRKRTSSVTTTATSSGPTGKPYNAPCHSDYDCASQYCYSSKCAMPGTSGPKVGAPNHCQTDYNCGGAAECYGNGQYQSSDSFVCVAGTLTPANAKCTTAANCGSASSFSCRSGYCYPLKSLWDPCTTNADCLNGNCPSPALVCSPPTSTSPASTSPVATTPPGTTPGSPPATTGGTTPVSTGGTTGGTSPPLTTPGSSPVSTTTSSAPSASPKPYNAACTSDYDCSSLYCYNKKCALGGTSGPKVGAPYHCQTDYNCGGAARCYGNDQPHSSDSYVCVAGSLTPSNSAKCSSSAQCGSGNVCISGYCYPLKGAYDPCTADGDCQSGLTCPSPSLICVPPTSTLYYCDGAVKPVPPGTTSCNGGTSCVGTVPHGVYACCATQNCEVACEAGYQVNSDGSACVPRPTSTSSTTTTAKSTTTTTTTTKTTTTTTTTTITSAPTTTTTTTTTTKPTTTTTTTVKPVTTCVPQTNNLNIILSDDCHTSGGIPASEAWVGFNYPPDGTLLVAEHSAIQPIALDYSPGLDSNGNKKVRIGLVGTTTATACSCWAVKPVSTGIYQIVHITCDSTDPNQKFTLLPSTGGNYLISSDVAGSYITYDTSNPYVLLLSPTGSTPCKIVVQVPPPPTSTTTSATATPTCNLSGGNTLHVALSDYCTQSGGAGFPAGFPAFNIAPTNPPGNDPLTLEGSFIAQALVDMSPGTDSNGNAQVRIGLTDSGSCQCWTPVLDFTDPAGFKNYFMKHMPCDVTNASQLFTLQPISGGYIVISNTAGRYSAYDANNALLFTTSSAKSPCWLTMFQ